ncbi:hypothetical protein CaCOL14_006048 [Colletotrichum acutatum]
MFDAPFLNEYHFFAATFSFNNGEFPDTVRLTWTHCLSRKAWFR